MKIWDISVRQPVFITMVVLAIVVLGIVSYLRIPVDLLPDVSFPVVSVSTSYPGASPDEVEDQVTSLLEESLGSLPGVDSITSTSSEGFSQIQIQFTLETDDEQAAQDVRERVSTLTNQLPRDANDPVVRQFDFSALPIMSFSVADTTGQYTPAQLRNLVEDEVQQPLERVRGVALVDVQGGQEREVKVQLDLAALTARRIVPQQVVQALQSENLNVAGGNVRVGEQELSVRTFGTFQTAEEIESVIVTQRGTSPVYVRDVAEVTDGVAERETVTRLNGEEAITVNIRKQSGTNTTDVAERVNDRLEEIRQANSGLEIVIARDDSEFVQDSINDAIKDLIYGGIFATLVVLAFFRDLRSTVITMIGLPVILIGTFFFMDVLGITLNSLTVLALALCVGLVIDDAIVVRENIFRWLEMGYTPREAARKGTAEVALPVVATTATIVSVFLPIAYAQGIIGQFFRDFGLTVAIAVLISLAEAVTLAPMLSAYFFKKGMDTPRDIDEDAGMETAGESVLDRIYARALNWTLDHKILAIIISAVVIVVSLASFPFVDQAFIPDFNQGEFDATLKMPPGTPLEVTEQQAIAIESRLLERPNVEDVFTTIGGQGTPDQATFFVKLVGGAEADTEAAVAELRQVFSNSSDILAFQSTSQQGAGGGSSLLGSRDVVIEMVSNTDDYPGLIAASDGLVEELKTVPGLADVESSYRPGKPELSVRVNRQRASDLGLTTAQIGSTIRILVNGQVASTFRGEGPESDIRVELKEGDQRNVDRLLNVNLLSATGRLVPLRNLAELNLTSGPTQIQRIDRQPAIVVGGNYTGERSDADVLADVRAELDTFDAPGVGVKLAGEAEQQQESFGNLFTSLLLAIVFIYMALASQFSSFIQPLLIMLALPLAVIGAVLALVFTGRPFDMTAMIGMILLMGLVTKNSILLVDFANRARDEGATADEAMRRAGPVRLRPILMTALSLILGLAPVALALGAGSGFRAPLATAVIGGMVTSTFLTLFIVPLAYSLLVGWLDKFSIGFETKDEVEDTAELREARALSSE